MAHYMLGIDETGGFLTSPFYQRSQNKNIKSFACGVSFVDKSDDDIKNTFVKLYKDFYGCVPTSLVLKDILRNESFHSKNLNAGNLKACKDAFAPIIDKVFYSEGTPSLYANNQDWWLTSVVVVIESFLDSYNFQDCDDIVIYFDGRKDTTWGALDENTAPYVPETNQQWEIYKQYHEFLKKQIWNHIEPIIIHRNLTGKLQLFYGQDSTNAAIAVADIAAKLVGRSLSDKSFVEGLSIHARSCRDINNLRSPEKLFDNNQVLEAFTTILHEIEKEDTKHMAMLPQILDSVRDKEDQYVYVWSLFYDFIKSRIEERNIESSRSLVDLFAKELKMISAEWSVKLKNLKELSCVDFIVLINEYSSHVGSDFMPFSFQEFEEANRVGEGRLLRRWENRIRFNLRATEICFNGYDFRTIQESLLQIWMKQKQLLEMSQEKTDNHSTAILGSLAQAYAFIGERDMAEKTFYEGLNISGSKKGQTYSYLFTMYHRARNLEKSRELFSRSTGYSADAYLSQWENDRSRKFNLVSYEKLRALELMKVGKTALPRFAVENHQELGSEYPIPLIKKWAAVSLYLEDKNKNKDIVKDLLLDAAASLDKASGITLRTMSLPVYQCAFLVGYDNDQYGVLYNELIKECKGFADYAKSLPELGTLQNKLDIWERALLLPFYYS